MVCWNNGDYKEGNCAQCYKEVDSEMGLKRKGIDVDDEDPTACGIEQLQDVINNKYSLSNFNTLSVGGDVLTLKDGVYYYSVALIGTVEANLLLENSNEPKSGQLIDLMYQMWDIPYPLVPEQKERERYNFRQLI